MAERSCSEEVKKLRCGDGSVFQGEGILAAVSIDGGVKFNLPSSECDVREPAWSPVKNKIFTPLVD